jgi:hypothetical protein
VNLEAARRFADLSGGAMAVTFAVLGEAQRELALGLPREAFERLDRHANDFDQEVPSLRTSVGVLAAVLAARLGRVDDARRHALGVLSVMQRSGWHAVHSVSSEQTAEFCAFAYEQRLLPDVVREIVRRRRYVPPPGASGEQWPWPFKVFTWGRLKVITDAKEHPLPRGKARELFCALLAAGGRAVAVTNLADALWADAEGDKARQAFDTTLHRLRQALPDPQLLELRDQHLSLSETLCWFDLRAAPHAHASAELLEGEPETPWLRAARLRWKQRTRVSDEITLAFASGPVRR